MTKLEVCTGPVWALGGGPAVTCVDQCAPDDCGVALLDVAADHTRWRPTPDGLIAFDSQQRSPT